MTGYNHANISDVKAVLLKMKECSVEILDEIANDSTAAAKPLRVIAMWALSVNIVTRLGLNDVTAKQAVDLEQNLIAHLEVQEGALKTFYDSFEKILASRPERITDTSHGADAMQAALAYADIVDRVTQRVLLAASS